MTKSEMGTRGKEEVMPTCRMNSNGSRHVRASAEENFFAELSPAAQREFGSFFHSSVYGDGVVLFTEGDPVLGVFVLCEGIVKLSICSKEGKRLIVRIANRGEVLGIAAALSTNLHEVTAETLGSCRIAFVKRDNFLHFLSKYPEAYRDVARQVILSYQATCEQLRTVSLGGSAQARLAALLLSWSGSVQRTTQEAKVNVRLTHEEIGESLAISREAVTRALNEFKRMNLIGIQGSTLTIFNRTVLEGLAAS